MNSEAPLPLVDAWPGRKTDRPSVFHYTSAAGLLGMIEHGELWASEAGGLNDYSEISAGRDFIREAWPAERDRFESRYDPDSATLLDQMIMQLGSDWWSTGPDGVFVLCASTVDDDANQWRLYADNGRGFSVELDTQPGYELIPSDLKPQTPYIEALKNRGGPVEVSPWRSVLYDPTQRKSALHEVLDRIGQRTLKMLESTLEQQIAGLEQVGSAAQDLDTLCQLIKSPGFAGENEARTVVSFRSASLADDYVFYRATSTGIVRTIHLRQTGQPESPASRTDAPLLPIKRIIMGPAQRHDLGAPALRALLARHGYENVPVEASQASLRWT